MSNNIGYVLKRYRSIEDVEQKELAHMIGITASSLCRLENGKSVDMQSTAKIIYWLFNGYEEQNP